MRRNTADTTISSTVPVANGTGASTETAASVSTPTRATRSPSGRRSCHDSGWRTRRSTTPCPSVPATRHCVVPAHVRRITTPVARSRPMPMISPTPAATVPAATEPSSNRGTITWSVTHCTAMLEATVQKANIGGAADGDEERPPVQGHHRPQHPDALACAVEPPRRVPPEPRNVSTGWRPGTERRSVESGGGEGLSVGFGRGPGRSRAARPAGRVRGVPRPPRLQQGVGRWEARRHRRAGSSRSGCAGRTSRPASPRRPSSAPGCCSPSGC